jgi:Rod binding domain-containing protein
LIKTVNNQSQIHLRNKPSYSKIVDEISMKQENKVVRGPLSEQTNIPDAYKKVAEGMEAQFTNHMIKQMNKSVNKSKQDTPAANYYNGLLDYERSKIMAKQGTGLKEVILDQIVPAHLKPRINNKNFGPKGQQVSRYQRAKTMESSLQEASNE